MLLGKDWGLPLHVRVLGLSPQRFEFEACHFRDLTTESYVTTYAKIVVYNWWAAQTTLVVDWDTMRVVWVVLWKRRPLMSFAPPLIVVQVYNLGNFHRVLRLILIAPSREYVSLRFDTLCDRPHLVGANQEEWAVVD